MESSVNQAQRPQNLLSLFPQAVLVVDEVGHVSFANAHCELLWGYPAQDLIGRNWMGLDTDLTLLRWKQLWRQSREQNDLRYTTHILT
ncbi:MAG: PAS domain-containing protein, partial [Bacteroidetes bacterium]